jgi:hypothetical protein
MPGPGKASKPAAAPLISNIMPYKAPFIGKPAMAAPFLLHLNRIHKKASCRHIIALACTVQAVPSILAQSGLNCKE